MIFKRKKPVDINKNGEAIIPKFLYGEAKTILPAWNFRVDFAQPQIFGKVEAFHVVDVTVPTYTFKQNTVEYGSIPKSYVTFDSGKQYQFSVTFEEDTYGTITTLSHSLQKRIMRASGVYNTLDVQNLGDCYITVYDASLIKVMQWNMQDIRYLGTDDVTLSYSSSEAMKLKMTFACDIITFENLVKQEEQNIRPSAR